MKTTAAKKTAAKKTAPAKTTPAKTTAAKKTAAKKTAPAKTTAARAASAGPALRVREGEDPWTAAELAELRAELESDVQRLRAEIAQAEDEIGLLMRDAGDGAGEDQADAGTKTFEREQEITLANNSREMLQQSLHALERLDDGSYGSCEECGQPVGKLRLLAFPRATLCVSCKQKQERR